MRSSGIQSARVRSRPKLEEGPNVFCLLYHRVADPILDPQLLALPTASFEAQMRYLKKAAEVVRASDLLSRSGTRSARPVVAVTFDDGYQDNLTNAGPILEKLQIPATVFVCTGYLGLACGFWWDELTLLLLDAGELPNQFSLKAGDRAFNVDLGGVSRYPPTLVHRHRAWNLLKRRDPTPRHVAYRKLSSVLRDLPAAERDSILKQLRALHSPFHHGLPSSEARVASAKEVRKLSESQWIDIGAHTVTHSVMRILSDKEIEREVHQSKDALEKIIGQQITGFAYPYGTRGTQDDRAARQLRLSGFDHAFVNYGGSITGTTDPLFLPRYVVRPSGTFAFKRFIQRLDQV